MALTRQVDLIVLAAGRGERAGAPVPKQFARAGPAEQSRTTVLMATLARAAAAGLGGRVVVTVPEGWQDEGRAAAAAAGLPEADVIVGGPGRLASLHLAADHLMRDRDPAQVVVVHDGTRPFTPPDLFTAVVSAQEGHDAAWPAAALANAVLTRATDDGRWQPGLSSDLLACATPIATTLAILRAAMAARTSDEGALIAGLVGLGVDWVTVPDSPLNFKVTTERDLRDAVAMLSGPAEPGPPAV